jgi:hypothetical protein
MNKFIIMYERLIVDYKVDYVKTLGLKMIFFVSWG